MCILVGDMLNVLSRNGRNSNQIFDSFILIGWISERLSSTHQPSNAYTHTHTHSHTSSGFGLIDALSHLVTFRVRNSSQQNPDEIIHKLHGNE